MMKDQADTPTPNMLRVRGHGVRALSKLAEP